MIPMNNKTMSFPSWLQIQVMYPLQLEVILVVWIQKTKSNTEKILQNTYERIIIGFWSL
jgi:hypothetical protein